MKELLGAGAAVDAKETWNGQTALMWAAAAGHAAVVQALIDHRADIHARSNSGATRSCLRCGKAAWTRSARCWRRERTSSGARPDGATPLLVAVINGHEDLVDFLLDKGADPNVEGGSTELTVAACA